MNLQSHVRDIIAAAKPTSAAIIKKLIRASLTVHFVCATENGHVAVDRSGGLFVEAFGKGFTNVAEALAELERYPDALIGVSRPYASARVVVDPTDKTIVRERQIIKVSRDDALPVAEHDETKNTRKALEETPLPQPPSIADAVAAVRTALADKMRLESDVTARRRAILTIEQRRREAGLKVTRARNKFGDEAANAVAREEEIPDLPHLRKAILKGEAEMAGCDAALPSARERVKPTEAALAEQSLRLVGASLDLNAALTAATLPIAVDAIAALAEPLAELVAVSIVRENLLGPRFHFDAKRHAAPIGAREIVKAFLEAIPPSLCSESLSTTQIEERASEIAATHLSKIQPNNLEH